MLAPKFLPWDSNKIQFCLQNMKNWVMLRTSYQSVLQYFSV